MLGLAAAFPGLWALFAPRSFFTDFPGAGFEWVSLFPPYTEHLIRDIGAFYLGFTTLFFAAAAIMDARFTRVALAAWLVAAVPHLVFHISHLDDLEAKDAIGQTIVLGLVVAIPVFMFPLIRRARH